MRLVRAVVIGALGGSALLAAAAAPPAASRAAELCVSVASASAECGPAQALWQDRSRLQVRVSDVVYRLRLHSSQADVTVMHGSMQIDEFTAPYAWEGPALRFDDLDKRTRYELKPGARPR